MNYNQELLFKKIKAMVIRAGHTAAQTALGLIGSSVFIQEINWRQLLSAVGLATLVSILKSLSIGMPETEE